ncbi:cation:proton antiporter domain-containing protein [Sorangium sp. So ce363]|uniref:cation:proton antiporter domain-containing protein n=1 Tax=Sorangium sp. So ce363 TaxID=3133304 RepID=UPI003F636973
MTTSLVMVAIGELFPEVEAEAKEHLHGIDFNKTLMQGMLGFLLFAAALHVNLADLKKQRVVIGVLATGGVLMSTVLVGGMTYALMTLMGVHIRPVYCLLFGALISPTDPIAVLGVLKHVGAPKELEMKIAGESLFNDGVAVVAFIGLLEIASGTSGLDLQRLSLLFVQEAIGGVLYGLELLIIAFDAQSLLAGLLAFPVVLLARFIAVALPVSLMKRRRVFTPGAIRILTWGGLRGGVSVALALSIPGKLADGTLVLEREMVLAITYVVVVVSIVVQGLTIGPLLRRTLAAAAVEPEEPLPVEAA